MAALVFPREKWHRVIGWMFVIPLALFVAAKGRDYYLSPAYPMLFAMGAVWVEHRFGMFGASWKRPLIVTACAALTIGGLAMAVVVLPLAPIKSAWRNLAAGVNGDLREEIGWPELVETVAHVRDALPPGDRTHLGILTGNYGEAGAIDLYGARYGLPRAISGINSYWQRGYGDRPPETLIVLGRSHRFLTNVFESCVLAGHTWNRYGIRNEETADHPDIFVCRRPRKPWPEIWAMLKGYG